MELTKLLKQELLAKCEELGITRYASKNKSQLIELINSKQTTQTMQTIEEDNSKKEIQNTQEVEEAPVVEEETPSAKIEDIKSTRYSGRPANQMVKFFNDKANEDLRKDQEEKLTEKEINNVANYVLIEALSNFKNN
jgi:hypothetical protein